MTASLAPKTEYRQWVYELSLSIYSSLLFVSFEQSRPFAWSTRYVYLWHPHAVSLTAAAFFLFYLELFLIFAGAIFIILRLMSLFSFSRVVLRALGGVVAVAGFPLVCLNGQNPLLLVAALIIAGVGFLLWAQRKWIVSAPMSVVVLILYYAFCAFFGAVRDRLMNRGSTLWDYIWLIYPILGFAFTIMWAAYFRHSGEEHPLLSHHTDETSSPQPGIQA